MFCLLHAHNRRPDCTGHAVCGNMKVLGLLAGRAGLHWQFTEMNSCVLRSPPHSTSCKLGSRVVGRSKVHRSPRLCLIGCREAIINLQRGGYTLDLTSGKTHWPLFTHFLNNWLAFARGGQNIGGLVWQLLDSQVWIPVWATFKCLGLNLGWCFHAVWQRHWEGLSLSRVYTENVS